MPIKINIQKNELLSVMNSLQNITAKKGTMAILANILLRTNDKYIEIVGTDLEVGIKKYIEADIVSPGSITLPSKKLFEIVRESGSDSLTIEEQENNWVKISAGSSNYNLAGMSSEEYPEFPEYDEENLVIIPGNIINELIEKTIFSVAQERETNYTLTGTLFEKEQVEEKVFFKMVSSDGHRLSIMEKEVSENIEKFDKNIIIPKKGIIEINKFCEGEENIQLGLEKKQIVLKKDNSLLIIRLMNGEFPDYKNILNVIDQENYIEVDRILFLESLKRTSIFTDSVFNSIELRISNNKMKLSSQNIDLGNAQDEIKVNYSGEKIELGFNCRYLIDTLQIISGDVVNMYISSSQSPCLITSNDDMGFKSIIMPMKL